MQDPLVNELILFDEAVESIDFSKEEKEDNSFKKQSISVDEIHGLDNKTDEDEEVEVKFKAKKKKSLEKDEKEDEAPLETENEGADEEEEDDNPLTEEELRSKYQSLLDLGYLALPDDYKFDGTEEGLEQAIKDSENYRLRSAAENLWSQLPDTFKPLLEYALKGGTDINKYKEVFVGGIDIEHMDLTDEENQRAVIRELYRERGFSNVKIEKDLTRIEDSGDLEPEAKDAKLELLDIRKNNQAKELERVQLTKRDKELKEQEAFNTLRGTLEQTEDFNGYEIPKPKRNEVLSSLYRKVRDDDGNVTTDFNHKLNKVVLRDPRLVLVLSDLMNKIEEDEFGNKFFNFSQINKKAESEATRKLKKTIDIATGTASKNSVGTGSVRESTGSEFDWDSVIL